MNRARVPASLRALAQDLNRESGQRLYLVGGYLRNHMLGLPVRDIDVCSRMRPEELLAACGRRGIPAFVKDARLGCVELRLPDGDATVKLEHTTFRRESYPPGGEHRPAEVAFTDSLEQDAARRDFTVNAMYWDVCENALMDPLGGAAHLAKRALYPTREAELVLRDDALRILRMVRFAHTLDFTIAPELYAAAARYAPHIADLSAERMREEFSRILLCDAAYPALHPDPPARVYAALDMLRDLGVLFTLLPDLRAGEGCAQSPQYHAYDVLQHNLHVCALLPPVLHLRLAGLLHDVAKPAVFARQGNFHGHDAEGEAIALRALGARGLRYSGDIARKAAGLIRHHMLDLDGRMRPDKLRLRFAELGEEAVRDLMQLRRADFIGSGMGDDPAPYQSKWGNILQDMLAQDTPWTQNALRINGDILQKALGLPPGKQIGELKEWLWKKCVQRPRRNTPETLLRMAKRRLRDL